MNSMPWTTNEIAQVLSLYEQGLPCAEISRAVGRSETAVRLKLLGLGYSSRVIEVGDYRLQLMHGDQTRSKPAARREVSMLARCGSRKPRSRRMPSSSICTRDQAPPSQRACVYRRRAQL